MHYFTTLKLPASQFSGFMHLSTKLSLLMLHSDNFAFSHHDEFIRDQRVSELNRTIKTQQHLVGLYPWKLSNGITSINKITELKDIDVSWKSFDS